MSEYLNSIKLNMKFYSYSDGKEPDSGKLK